MNSIDPHISFTIEHESNGQLSFLDTLISRDNKKLNIDIYRKPTHTDRYLDFRSHHDREHKISTAATLLHRALKLPNSESGKAREIDRISIALQSNGYPPKVTADIIRKKSSNPPTPSPEELVGMFFSWADPMNNQSFAVLPYIKGITEPLTRILKSHDIRVTNKPIKTLQQEFSVPKFRPRVVDQCNVVYKIPCASCPWSYIGETKRSFSTRRKEHIRNTKQCAKGSNVAKHAWTLDHAIDFENAEIIDKGNNRIRKTLESWHTAKTECVFQKQSDNTGLRVFFNGPLRIYNCNGCCKRWYFTFNGAECTAPDAIDGVVYMATGASPNAIKDLHRVRMIEGVCEKVSKGEVKVGFWVGNCAGYGAADAYTGWNSVSRIYVEEVPPPQH
ncbi:hypothetical protein ACROYT_G012971 [Oculina patagonica]